MDCSKTLDTVTFGQLKFGDLFLYVGAANNTDTYMKICGGESNAANLTNGNTSYLLNTETVLPLIGKLEVRKICRCRNCGHIDISWEMQDNTETIEC